MIELADIFNAADAVFSHIWGTLRSLQEIVVNTWQSDKNPVRDFSFDFRKYTNNLQSNYYWGLIDKNYRSLVESIERNHRPLLAALAYAISVLLTCKIVWYCLTHWCRRSHNASGEAKRWFMQAELDHQASQNDMNDDNPAYEWVCFKCQQATEKAVKAALIARKGPRFVPNDGHDLIELCEPLGDVILSEQVVTLQNIIGVTSRMRYPDTLPYPKVPHDMYCGQEASNAWEMAGQILQHIHQTYIS